MDTKSHGLVATLVTGSFMAAVLYMVLNAKKGSLNTITSGGVSALGNIGKAARSQ